MIPPPIPASGPSYVVSGQGYDEEAQRSLFLKARRRGRLAALGALLAFAPPLLIFAMEWLGVAFSSRTFGWLATVAACLTPCAAFPITLAMGRGVWRWAGAILVAPLALPFAAWAFLTLIFNSPKAVQQLQDLPVGENHVVVYQTNGGATTHYGIRVQQEKALGLGLRRVRQLYWNNDALEGSVEAAAAGSVRIRCQRWNGSDEVKTVKLERL